MDVKEIALNILVLAGIWAVVELALMLRKTRSSVSSITKDINEVTTTANKTIEDLQPIVSKVDGMVTDLEPAVQQVQPLLEKANTAVDVVTVDLANVNDILVDVSSVTDTASNVTSTVSKAANSAVSGVAGVVGKFTSGGKGRQQTQHRLPHRKKRAEDEQAAAEPQEKPAVAEASEEAPASSAYFTYGSDSENE